MKKKKEIQIASGQMKVGFHYWITIHGSVQDQKYMCTSAWPLPTTLQALNHIYPTIIIRPVTEAKEV